MTRPQTVVHEPHNPTRIHMKAGLSETPIDFTVYGMTPERSYEDRPVFFASDTLDMSLHIKAEDAIELGQLLVKHGTKALLANMIGHQHIHHVKQLKQYVSEDRVEKIVYTVISDGVVNHGDGWRLHILAPVWKEGKAPEYNEDFFFETPIYWSPIEEEFEQQKIDYGFGLPIEIVNYNRAEDVAKFEEAVRLSMENDGHSEDMEEHVAMLAEHIGVDTKED